jgi:energy-coupling factor transport system substrate-specific component
MTWQLASFVILGLALAGGFAWYERARPNARVVALVATLAAFAALGRIAFAALPNVKPTTDIVLISGYALGGAPGFVVGALGGLTSNFFFGQGPWTPWQMAAWGATGLLGAGLALITRRRLRRWPLALICAAAGLVFAAVQDFGDWVNYSDHSPAQLGIYVSKGIGFDLVHAAGCLAFALAFGPALTQSLIRFGARLHVTWRPAVDPSNALRVMLPALVVAAALAQAGAPGTARAATPAGYLLGAQHSDGGFGSAPSESSADLFTGWAALGLAAEGRNPAEVRRGGSSALDYVRAGVRSLPDVGALERTILIVATAGAAPQSFGGRDLIAALERQIKSSGSVADQLNLTAFAVLALRAAGIKPAAKTISWLARQQNRDGGFSFATAGAGGDVDDTGAALQALAGSATASASAARARGVAFLRGQQNPDGGFAANPGGDSNAQSTAWAVQGMIAAGADPDALHRRGAPSPLAFIRSLIDVDGHVHYSRASDQTPVWVTAEAVLALARKPLPLAAVPRRHRVRRTTTTTPRTTTATARTTPPAAKIVGGARPATAPARRPRPPPGAAVASFATDAGVLAALILAPAGLR